MRRPSGGTITAINVTTWLTRLVRSRTVPIGDGLLRLSS